MRQRRLGSVFCAIAAGTLVFNTAAAAQVSRTVARADSLLGAGEVARAESLYYVASRRDTRDVGARISLGRYLVSRGAFRIGSTLLDEAMQFGADTILVDKLRAPALQLADDWASLSRQPLGAITAAERARARWLAANAPSVKGADSVTVPFEPSSVAGLGRIAIVIGSDTLAADVDPNADELVLGDYGHFASLVQMFTGGEGDRAAVVQRASIGDLVFERVPARVDQRLGPARARIGMSFLARYAPTFDAGAGVLTLRRDGRVPASMGKRRVPALFSYPGVRLARAGRLVPIESPAGRAVLAEARWTLDGRRGEVALEVDER